MPPPSDEERELEEDFISSGIHVDKEKLKTTGHRKASTILGDRCAKKDTKAMEFESCLEVWSQSLSARIEAHNARAKKYKAQSSKATNPISDPYSIEECMKVLESCGADISQASYNKAYGGLEKELYKDGSC